MTAVHVAEPHNENDQQRQHAEQSASAESVSHVLTPSFGRASKLTPAVVLHLQQTIGNRAVQRLIASYRAKKTTVRREEDENASPGAGAAATGGTGQLASLDQNTLEAAMGPGGKIQAASELNTVQRNEMTSNQPAPVSTSPPTFVNPSVVTGPQYLPDGAFTLHINWQTDGTSGFLVQEINNTLTVTACNGGPSRNANQTYYEAWSVLPDSTVSPTMQGVNDTFDRPAATPIFHIPTSGTWRKQGTTYWVEELDSSAGFAPGNVANAGLLMATMNRPNNLNMLVQTRTHGGHLDSCNPANQTHTSA